MQEARSTWPSKDMDRLFPLHWVLLLVGVGMGLSPFPTLGGGKWKLRWKNREAKLVFGGVPDFQLNKNCPASFFKV